MLTGNTVTAHEPQEHVVGSTRTTNAGVRSDIRSFIAQLFLVCLTILLLMCLVSGRWMGTKTAGHWTETSIWGTCNCANITAVTNCGERDRKTDATKAFSIIGAIFEFFAVLMMLWYPKGTILRLPIAFCLFMAAISFIITIALFGNIFDKSMCGSGRLKDEFHLDWAYGIRIVEFIFVTALGIFILLRVRGRKTLLAVIICLYLCVFTTTSRGWASWKHRTGAGFSPTEEYGLWDYCTCERAGDDPCDRQERLFRASEAFEIIATITAIVLTAMVVYALKVPRPILIIFAWSLVFFMMLPWIFMAALYDRHYCGMRFKDIPGYDLHWGFGIQVAISGLMIICAALISIMPTYQRVYVT